MSRVHIHGLPTEGGGRRCIAVYKRIATPSRRRARNDYVVVFPTDEVEVTNRCRRRYYKHATTT